MEESAQYYAETIPEEIDVTSDGAVIVHLSRLGLSAKWIMANLDEVMKLAQIERAYQHQQRAKAS